MSGKWLLIGGENLPPTKRQLGDNQAVVFHESIWYKKRGLLNRGVVPWSSEALGLFIDQRMS